MNDGQVYPVGLYLIDYAAQHAAAELVNILLQETGSQGGIFASVLRHDVFGTKLEELLRVRFFYCNIKQLGYTNPQLGVSWLPKKYREL